MTSFPSDRREPLAPSPSTRRERLTPSPSTRRERLAPSRQTRLWAALLLAGLVAGCSNTPNSPNVRGVGGNVVNATGDVVAEVIGGPIIPDTTVSLGPSVTYPLEKLVYWGVYAAAAWLILDPLAPNWQIQEARFPGNHVHLSLAMKRYYAGGAGEARVVFQRRARELMRAGGYASYEIVEYAEGLDSSMLGSQRTAEGVVRFVKKAG